MPVLLDALEYVIAGHVEHPREEPGSPEFWWKIGLSALLVVAGGVFAGLTLGLMGLDILHLRVLATSSDDPEEKRNAQKVLNLMQKGRHWILVVLLLSNVVINESLPIFLDSALGGGIAAVAIATTTIVIFGYAFEKPPYSVTYQFGTRTYCREIIPQAVCARYGLLIGAKCAPFVLALMYLFAPIAWPIAKLLDWVLGAHDEHTYKKAELRSFLQFHRQGEEPLRDDEISILNGVLSLNETSVELIMTPFQDVASISADTILDREKVDHLVHSGYSRFPVHATGKPTLFIGLLLVKKLLRYDPQEKKMVSQLPLSVLPEASPSISCFQALDYFQTGRSHLLLITKFPGRPSAEPPLGVVTLEDIIEEIIGEEIIDETDRFESNTSKSAAKRQTTAAVMKGIFENALRARPLDTQIPTIEEGHEVQCNSPTETQRLLPSADAGKPDFYGTTR